MQVTLTKDQTDALAVAAIEQKTTADDLVQAEIDTFANQMVYKYLLPVADRLIALKAQVEALTAENAALRAQIDVKAVSIVP